MSISEAKKVGKHENALGSTELWTKKKIAARCVAAALYALHDVNTATGWKWFRRAEAMQKCGDEIIMSKCNDCGHTEIRAWRCRDRLCPICQWRLSLQRFSTLNAVHGLMEQKEQNYRVALITLTLRNVDGPQLDGAVKRILDGWGKLTKLRTWQRWVKGFARSVELTRSKDGTYHPHLHALVYFAPTYDKEITTFDLVQMWRNSCALDYDPVCYMQFAYRKGKRKVDVRGSDHWKGRKWADVIAEATKYAMKAELLTTATPTEIVTVDNALAGKRLISYGGIVRELRKELGLQTDDEADTDTTAFGNCKLCGSEDTIELAYTWAVHSYRLTDSVPSHQRVKPPLTGGEDAE